ncbi:MAG: MFS transporter [Chloroflexi bacterium]|nr:MFS transporter [Chloroflexota bacterium]
MVNLAEVGRSTLARYIAALEYRDYRTMWLANLSAQAAAWALIVARGWLVFDMTHSSGMVGVVTFVAMAPLFFVPPFAGVLADRMDRRTLLAWTYGINLVHNLVLAVLALTGTITMWQIMLLTLVNGVARAAQMPTSQALAANLVPREKLLNALSLNAATLHGSRLIGPGLATPLLALFGAPAAFFLCTAFYAIGWVQILGIKTRSRGGVQQGESFVRNFAAGLRYAWGHPLIRMVIVMVMFHCGLTMAFESLLPNFSAQRLEAGATGFSILMTGVGAGALVGSIFIGGIQSTLARGRLYLVMALLSGLGQVMLSFTPNMAAAIAATVVMGASQAAFMTLGQAITQSLAQDEYRGRIASINTFSLGGIMSFMNLANGFLGTEFSAASILLVNGLVFAGIVALSASLATPRQVYARGFPAEAAAGAALH